MAVFVSGDYAVDYYNFEKKKKKAFTLTKVKRKPECHCQSESQRVVRGKGYKFQKR